MFGLSFWEIGIILAIALIVLGPSKLPDLAKSFGKALREFRKATEDFKSTMDDEMYRPDPPVPPQTKLPAESVARPLPPPATPSEAAAQAIAAEATAAAHASAAADPAHAAVPPEAEIVPPPQADKKV